MAAVNSGLRVLRQHDVLDTEPDPKTGTTNHKTLKGMSAALEMCINFTSDLMSAMKMLQGAKHAKTPANLDIRKMVTEIVALSQLASGSVEGVSVESSVQEDLPQVICADSCIQHMLMNYLSNALHHTSAGGEVRVELTSELHPNGPWLEVKVHDTGCGIDESQKESCFEPFVSGRGSVGLGLYLVKQQSESLGGCCGVHHNHPHGTVFWFRVPYTAADDKVVMGRSALPALQHATGCQVQKQPADQEKNTTCSARGEAPSVLLIDDTETVLSLSALELQLEGFTVLTANGPAEGLVKLKEAQYAMVACDINMPLKNGDKLTEEFRLWECQYRNGEPRQPIMAISAYCDENTKKRCIDAGMQGVLGKPVTPGDLRHAISTWTGPLVDVL